MFDDACIVVVFFLFLVCVLQVVYVVNIMLMRCQWEVPRIYAVILHPVAQIDISQHISLDVSIYIIIYFSKQVNNHVHVHCMFDKTENQIFPWRRI